MGLAIALLIGKDFVGSGGDETDPVAESVVDEADSSREGFNSIGVLPFVNMSDDPAQEYFSDGISEELLNALAKLKDLQVAARTSSFAFKGRNQPVRDIGAQLNVDTVLEGSVRKAGNKIRITAQLIEVENGYHLWSETYDSKTATTSGRKPTIGNSPIYLRYRTRSRPRSLPRCCRTSTRVRTPRS
jgi:TolB-like protein